MNLVRHNQNHLFDEMDQIFNNFFSTPESYFSKTRKNYDIEETEENYLLNLDLPGVKQNDLSIDVIGNQLNIKGERKSDRVKGSYKNSFLLPETVDSEKIEAHLEDGVLSLLLPKVDLKKSRKIEVQSGKEGFFQKFLGSHQNQAS